MADDINLSGEVTLKQAGTSDKAPDNASESEDKTADAAATALATGLTLLTAGLGVFGGLTGAVARMARNHQTWTGIAVGLVLASVVLALASRLVRSTTTILRARWYRVLLWVSLVTFVLGLSIAMLTLNDSLGQDDRPSIAATTTREATSGTVTIAGTAKAGGLNAEDKLYVSLVALSKKETQSRQVYYALVGPSQDGLVDHSFSVILAPDVEAVVITVGNPADEEDNQGQDGGPVPSCSAPDAPDKSSGPTPTPEAVEPPNELTACAYVVVKETGTGSGTPKPDPAPTPTASPND